MTWDPELITDVLTELQRAIANRLRVLARRKGHRGGRHASVTVIQRFGSALSLNVHFHALVSEGVWVEGAEDDGPPVYAPLKLTTKDVQAVLQRVERRVLRLLVERDLLDLDDEQGNGICAPDAEPDERLQLALMQAPSGSGSPRARGPGSGCAAWAPATSQGNRLLACSEGADGASLVPDAARFVDVGRRVQTRLPPSPRERRRDLTEASIDSSATREDVRIQKRMHAAGGGFDLHAGVFVARADREKLERVARYLLRPALVLDRIRLVDGEYEVGLKRPWSDGTHALRFSPHELMEKLSVLVPMPRANMVRYHGVLAPAAKWREHVLPRPDVEGRVCGHRPPGGRVPKRRVPWAMLLRRVFLDDVLRCPTCRGARRLIGEVTDPDAIAAILEHLGIDEDAEGQVPVRGPSRSGDRPSRASPGKPESDSSAASSVDRYAREVRARTPSDESGHSWGPRCVRSARRPPLGQPSSSTNHAPPKSSASDNPFHVDYPPPWPEAFASAATNRRRARSVNESRTLS